MTKVKNLSFTLFRWQEYIWRPDEVIVFNENGYNAWEDVLARELMAKHHNLIDVTQEVKQHEAVLDPEEKRKNMLARLEKARAARKANRERTNSTT